MTGFLAGLGAKLAERWATLLVLPGLIYLAVGSAATVLGHRHALDLTQLTNEINRVASRPASSNAGAILLVSAGALAASAVAGLLAAALGQVLERFWHRPQGHYLVDRVTRSRSLRWQRADRAADRLLIQNARDRPEGAPAVGRLSPETVRALARRDAIALEPPAAPTWIGDRFHALAERMRRAYALDVYAVWPRLWLVLPDQPRADITTARDAHTAAARLGGWTVLYLLLTAVWWPALPVAALLAGIAWYKARQTAEAMAELIEAAVDCHARDLAAQLGLACEGRITRRIGEAMTDLLRKDRETRSDLDREEH
ncbi:hypothetical protein ACFY3G_48245 [Streptomyces phaeochromogenes]|uniref:hypothetical protein n=1 Tax=Streptomyces phaeochromogenes TaxID=1923 RepID=UPI0036C299BA